MKYIRNATVNVHVVRPGAEGVNIPVSIFYDAIVHFHKIIAQFQSFEVEVFSILGMRNLSSFIGELYSASVVKVSDGIFRKNPHQDGYPDLLLMDDKGRELWRSLETRLRDKSPFSPFGTGGIEIKATCGSLPTPAILAKRGLQKPDIGNQRISLMRGYDWKAHHRETNNLMGILWDFVDNIPIIAAIFYSSSLNEVRWGKIIHPYDGGGRTTSVSIMTREGVKEMYNGWLCVINNEHYTKFIDSYNKSNLLAIAMKNSH